MFGEKGIFASFFLHVSNQISFFSLFLTTILLQKSYYSSGKCVFGKCYFRFC